MRAFTINIIESSEFLRLGRIICAAGASRVMDLPLAAENSEIHLGLLACPRLRAILCVHFRATTAQVGYGLVRDAACEGLVFLKAYNNVGKFQSVISFPDGIAFFLF